MSAEENDFYQRLSHLALDLLKEPLSELTRKRQVNLLLSATFSLLLSYTLVNLGEGSIAGINFTLTQPYLLRTISGLLTAYFLTVYILAVIRDLALERYSSMSSSMPIAELASEHAEDIRQSVCRQSLWDTLEA